MSTIFNHLKEHKNDLLAIAVLIIISITLLLIPTGFEKLVKKNAVRARGRVISTDNSDVTQSGIIKTGAQVMQVKVLNGRFKGRTLKTVNYLMGKMDIDKVFNPGDTALLVITYKADEVLLTNAMDHYRIHVEFVLLALFATLLIALSRWTGAKAILSFIVTALFIWKILLPGFLREWPPIPLSLAAVTILTAIIVFSIGGVNRKGIVAFLGAISGVFLTCLLSIIFGELFKIHGAVKPFSESLLYTGFSGLNLKALFLSGIFISSSGAVMDIAMDIAASMKEIHDKNPNIHIKELIGSGLRVGNAVIGTMTTTLLLAYTGGFSAMFMVFIAHGTPTINILNIQYVSAEILTTLVGSFGLVTVAPLTAIFGGILYSKEKVG